MRVRGKVFDDGVGEVENWKPPVLMVEGVSETAVLKASETAVLKATSAVVVEAPVIVLG